MQGFHNGDYIFRQQSAFIIRIIGDSQKTDYAKNSFTRSNCLNAYHLDHPCLIF